MNSKSYLLLTIGVVFVLILTMTIFLVIPEKINAGECRLVRILGPAKVGVGETISRGVSIEPEILHISKGGCVIFVNMVRAGEISLVFDAKKCEAFVSAPTGFKREEVKGKDCYVASFISMGQTSSFMFDGAGTFYYEVEAPQGVKLRGQIVVSTK